jgi:hypothetical protein
MLDQLIAFRVLYMLVTPFKDTNAFKLGIVDENGKLLKKMSDLNTAEEKAAYNMLVRLVFNLKRLLAKVPGGNTRLANIAAAYFLVKEHYNKSVSLEVLEEQLNYLTQQNSILVEETLTVMNFVKLFEDAPVNATGPLVSTDEPVIKREKKKVHSFKAERKILKP